MSRTEPHDVIWLTGPISWMSAVPQLILYQITHDDWGRLIQQNQTISGKT